MNFLMTSKTTLSIFSVAAIAVIAAAAGIMINDNTEQLGVEPTDVSLPYEVPFWQGVPTLAMNISPSDKTDFHELDAKSYDWLQRLIENSETIVNDKEIKQFFDVSDGNYLYKINGEIYTIHYTDNPTVRLDQNYIKAIPLDDLSSNARDVASFDNTWLQKGLTSPYKWIEVTPEELVDYQSFNKDGKIVQYKGQSYEVRYIGAESAELENTEYEETYNKSIGIFEEEHGHE